MIMGELGKIYKMNDKTDERQTIFLPGMLDDIKFVVMYARYQDKWVYAWHRYRKSFEHAGGHVEPGEAPMAAAMRELFEETGITDCKMRPLWDYVQYSDKGEFVNNGRVYLAEVHSLGELPESEMDRIELFDTTPENYTYDREDDLANLEKIGRMLKADVE